jgi:cellulose biosynthesis protein BcsQ
MVEFRRRPVAKRQRQIAPGIPVTPQQMELFLKVRQKGAQAICFFNNKGGVGKTTLVANLAAELAINFGAKILVVDGDPQCNLSQYVLGEEESLSTYSDSNIDGIYNILRPISLGKGYGEKLPIRSSASFGFDIIIGDPRLALQEDLLAGDWRDARGGGMRGIRTTYIFANVVRQAKRQGYDFVFFDMGPALGAINRSILLAMDFFVVPMTIDIFSLWAIKNIGATVGVWQKEIRTGISLAEDSSDIPEADQERVLKFLGYVT